MKWNMLYHVLDILACSTDQKRFIVFQGREQDSIVEVRDAERPRSSLFSIDTLDNIKNIWAYKKKHFQLDIALVSLRAIASQKVGQNHVYNKIHNLGSKKRYIVLFFKCCARVQYGFHFCNKGGIATHNAGHLTCRATQLEEFHFHNWAAVMSRDALLP